MYDKWLSFITEGELKDVGIVACLDDKQRFLIIRRSNIDERGGQWTIPGGHIDDEDSSIEAGACRELKEETWSSLDQIKDLDNSEIPIYLLEKALEMHKDETDT